MKIGDLDAWSLGEALGRIRLIYLRVGGEILIVLEVINWKSVSEVENMYKP